MSDESTNEKADYRDIRDGLRERISLLEGVMDGVQATYEADRAKREAAHKKQIDNIKSTLANYRNMLELEDDFMRSVVDKVEKVGPVHPHADIPSAAADSRPSLSEFLIGRLSDQGQMSKDELRNVAEQAGYFQAGAGGRAIHATMINLVRAKRVNVTVAGKYIVSELEKALF